MPSCIFGPGFNTPRRSLFDQIRSACPLAGGHSLPPSPAFLQNSNICK